MKGGQFVGLHYTTLIMRPADTSSGSCAVASYLKCDWSSS